MKTMTEENKKNIIEDEKGVIKGKNGKSKRDNF
jgi:hypothetical protein